MTPLKAGLLGLGRGGRLLADALTRSSWSRLVAVAGHRPEQVEQFSAQHPQVHVHNDLRSLVVDPAIEALFVALPPYLRGNLLPLAAERVLPTFMLTPPMRTFEETLELSEKFEAADCPLVIARAWGVEPDLQPAALGLEDLGRFFLARGQAMTWLGDDWDWRGVSRQSGGGVLLDLGYGLLDIFVQAIGLPSLVYTMSSSVSRPDVRALYDTEDTAGVLCHFENHAIATLSTCWTTGPEEWTLELFGVEGSIHVDPRRIVLRDRPGRQVLSESERNPNLLLPQVEEFLSTLLSNRKGLKSRISEHLATMAVVEAAYLSAKTGQPESPATILQMHDVPLPRRR